MEHTSIHQNIYGRTEPHMQAECRVMSGGGLVLVVPHHEIANALDILNRINKNIKLLHQK